LPKIPKICFPFILLLRNADIHALWVPLYDETAEVPGEKYSAPQNKLHF
jgi:hypothetical protein